MLALLRKELKTYFLTPTGWIFLAVFLLVSGLFFSIELVFQQSSQYSSYLMGILFVFLLVVPLLTMRIFTEEKRLQTDKLLLTAPVNLWDIVLGKYFAAVIVFLITVAVTFLYPLFLSFHGKLEWSMIAGTYIGFILLGASFISVGVFVSQATEGVAGAAILTFCVLTITFIVDLLQPHMPSGETAGLVWVAILMALALFRLFSTGKNAFLTALVAVVFALVLLVLWLVNKEMFAGLIGRSLTWVSLTRRFGSFVSGILRLDSVIYYLSFSWFFLFLTVQGLEKRRWS